MHPSERVAIVGMRMQFKLRLTAPAEECFSMWRKRVCIASALAVVLFTSGAGAAGIGVLNPARDNTGLVQRVHSVYEAEETLERRGYYDVRLERASLPYSFNACKRGVRYHIHVNWYGESSSRRPLVRRRYRAARGTGPAQPDCQHGALRAVPE